MSRVSRMVFEPLADAVQEFLAPPADKSQNDQAPPPGPGRPEDGPMSASAAPNSAAEKSAEQFAAEAKAAAVAELKRFTDAFGPQGVTWYGEGRTYAQAQQLVIESLREENAKLAERLKQAGV